MELSLILLLPALALLAAITWGFWQLMRGIGYLLMKLFGAVGMLFKRVFGFVRSEAIELVQFASAGLSLCFLLPFTAGNFVTGRWDRARHYAKSIEDEFASALTGAYRVILAHPLRLVGLGGVLEGVEKRLPTIKEFAPKQMRNMAQAMEFEGYDVVGTLPAGGSGAQLYTAHPKPKTVERFLRKGREISEDVVIKSFALVNGSTLPQIIRESRALEAANNLGLIYEHDLDEDRFFYVMPYVKGEGLDVMIERMHARSGEHGLDRRQLALALGYARDLLRSLDRFHEGGLWHKDVKPANLIISDQRAHLVDFGLVTPLQSALTLTTHGTEYYRDPEMVRLAMQGVKVHEVDGVKFDLYSAGAVLFSMIENSFPAHGSLSQLTKTCPEALAWIVRRSMADIGSRYRGAWEMLDDLKTVANARDPYQLRPADLPSMQRGESMQRPADVQVKANRFGMPNLRARLASGVRSPRRPMRAGEQPPKLPNERKLERERQWLAKDTPSRRLRRGRRLFALVLIGMVFAGAMLVIEKGQTQSEWELLSRAREAAQASGQQRSGGPQKLVHSSATDPQREDFENAQAILKLFERKRGSAGTDLSTLFSGTAALGEGSKIYILQDNYEGVTDAVLADLERKLDEQGFELEHNVANHTRESKLRFAVLDASVGDESGVTGLESYLEQHPDLDAVLWICEGEAKGSGLYELVLNPNLN